MSDAMDYAGVPSERLTEILAGCEGAQGGPWKLDKFACYIWAPSEKGGDFPVMDEPGENGRVARLRGWGYYTGNGQGALGLSPDEGERRQRLTGEHVARLDPATVAAIVTELLSSRAAISDLTARLAEAERERDAAFAANEHDRSFVADARNTFKDALARRTWLLHGRGSYEWDDDRWKDEFRQAIKELEAPMEALGKIGIDWSLCPTNADEIAAARIDWKTRATAAEAALATAVEVTDDALTEAEAVLGSEYADTNQVLFDKIERCRDFIREHGGVK